MSNYIEVWDSELGYVDYHVASEAARKRAAAHRRVLEKRQVVVSRRIADSPDMFAEIDRILKGLVLWDIK